MNPSPNPHLKLSVVIVASHSPALLECCLASLNGQAEAADTEIIVVSNYGNEGALERRFPLVQCVSLPETATVPELRTAGILHSSGEIIAVIEDHCLVDEHWCSEIKNAHRLSYAAIGGAVENAPGQKLSGWAMYFFDYGKYMLPCQAGASDSLSGINVSYKRSVLERLEPDWRHGFFEAFIHEELKRQGCGLYLMPSAVVYHNQNYQLRQAMIGCYHWARSYGGMRVAAGSPVQRAVFTIGSPLLPLVLSVRIALRTFRKGRHLKEFACAFPFLLLLVTSWSLGEFCGYAFGEGTSSKHWR